MKKEFEVTNVETIAFDDQIVTLKSPDATVKIHLHDQADHNGITIGKKVSITIDGVSTKKAAKKPVAKKVAKKTAAKKVAKAETPVVELPKV